MHVNIRSLCASLTDLVLPRSKRRMRTEGRAPGMFPVHPETTELLGVRVTTLSSYKERATADLIQSLKYDASGHAARLAASLLADYLPEEIEDIARWWSRPILLTPLPLHKARERERGFNQTERVLANLPSEYRDGTLARFAPHALARVRETLAQTRLSRRERLTNVAGAFRADPSVKGTHVILLDDVVTTGATLAEATRTLEAAGASVSPIALARA